jgi:predicted RNA binding protein YcfA (HicA-like mRNA interferase family)
MGKFEKLIVKLLSGSSDNSFKFDDLRNILLKIGFTERTTGGSHRIFYKDGIEEIINIQPKNSEAKPYQVKQVRTLILKYKLMNDGK